MAGYSQHPKDYEQHKNAPEHDATPFLVSVPIVVCRNLLRGRRPDFWDIAFAFREFTEQMVYQRNAQIYGYTRRSVSPGEYEKYFSSKGNATALEVDRQRLVTNRSVIPLSLRIELRLG